MSKSVALIIFSVLIALALVVGIYGSVQGASAGASTKSAQAYIDASVNLAPSSNQTSSQKLESVAPQADPYSESDGDCHHESAINPEDY